MLPATPTLSLQLTATQCKPKADLLHLTSDCLIDRTVIEADGINHEQLEVDSIQIFAGQRYSFIVSFVGEYLIVICLIFTVVAQC